MEIQPSTEPVQKPVILMIADISGYTAFVHAHRQTLAHAQVILTDLLQAVLREVELPVRVAKLEGDAIFCYAERGTSLAANAGKSAENGVTLPLLVRFIEVFRRRRDELEASNLCNCEACLNLSRLQLKVIVHAGTALFYQIYEREELSGPDVILTHRLLKNDVPGHEYLLLTEEAWRLLAPGAEFAGLMWRQGLEREETLEISIQTHFAFLTEPPVAVVSPPYLRKLVSEATKFFQAFWYRIGVKPLSRPKAAERISPDSTQN